MGCRHCHDGKVCRPGGLCRSCYYTHGVRQLYRRRSKLEQDRLPPPRATKAPPGSERKVLVLMKRARRRQGLWHPEDAPLDRRLVPALPFED
jgi:hypothetical protein